MNELMTIRFERDERITAPGYETGRLELWTKFRGEPGWVFILKEHGHHYWSSRGQQGYAGACFWVLRVLEDRGSGAYKVERLKEFYLKKEVG